MVDSVTTEIVQPRRIRTRIGVMEKAQAALNSRWMPWVIIGFGVVLRLIQYMTNRSLWYDEAMLSLNILNRDYIELTGQLDDNQAAPIGYLWVTKFFVQLLGNSEYSLRLFPMICGTLSLVLLYYAAKRFLRPGAVLIALVLFATTLAHIYYSSEVKQYAVDVAAALVIYLAASYVWENPRDIKRILIFQVAGVLSLWFSFPAVFLLAGVGLTFLVATLRRRDWPALAHLMLAFAGWGITFLTTYLLTLRNVEANEYLVEFWNADLVPFPPTTVDQVKWYFDRFFGWFKNEEGVYLTDFAGFLFIAGAVSVYMTKRIRFFILLSPILFLFIASAMDRYPVADRVILFMTPLLIMLVAEGAQLMIEKTRTAFPALGTITLAVLLIYPIFGAVQPTSIRQDLKPVMQYVQENRQPGDVIWLYYFVRPAFEYYRDRYGFEPGDYLVGTSWVNNRWTDRSGIQRTSMREDLDRLRGNDRVWLFFTNSSIDEQSYTAYLNSVGRRLGRFRSWTASVYLYDLNPANDRPNNNNSN